MSLLENLSPAEKYERDKLDGAFRALLRMEEGRRVLFWLLENAALYDDPFAVDEAYTNYRIGAQSIARRLIIKLNEIDPRLYPQLMLDAADVREKDRAAMKALSENQESEEDEY